MSTIKLVLRELHRSETSLGRDLLAMADRHTTDQEIHHLAHDLARWSQHHVHRIAHTARDHDAQLNPAPRWSLPLLPVLTQKVSTTLASRPETGILLVADLRRIYRKAAGVSLDWELLAQAAQAMKLPDLLNLAQDCHPETLRQMQWANSHLKVVSPQVIAT